MPKRLPEHAKHFPGRAKNIPERDVFMLPYQERWIRDRAIMKIIEKSRRVGISYASSYEDASRHSLASNILDTWVSSRDELTARQNVRDCMGFARVLESAASDLGEQVLTDEKQQKHSVYVIQFANGRRLNSLSSNPDAFAGRGGYVKLDEFALRKDPMLVYSIAKPTITWGGRLAIISTHRGSGNYFNTLIREIREKNNPKKFSLHRVTLQDALDQGFLWKLQSKLADDDSRLDMDEGEYFDYERSSAPDEETFLQEFMCVPADDASAFIPYALIDGCSYGEGEAWEYTLQTPCINPLYIGVDIGRKKDLTSMTAVEHVGGVDFVRARIDLQKVSFTGQEQILYPWFAKASRVCIDNTGLGMQFAERAGERFGHKIEGVTFTNQTKEAMAYPVRTAFEDRAIRIPFSDDALRSDIRRIRRETTAAGNVRFVAESNDDGHADRFWSLALALHARNSKQTTYSISLC